MNRLLQTIAAAMLFACYALPVLRRSSAQIRRPHGEGLHRQARKATPRPRILARSQRNLSRGDGRRQTVNAGGRYIVVILPCGSECQAPTFLDVRTGRITQFFTVSNWGEVSDDFEPVVSRSDSRLIVFRGKRNEQGINGDHYYLIDDRGQFKHLTTTDTGGDFKTTLKIE